MPAFPTPSYLHDRFSTPTPTRFVCIYDLIRSSVPPTGRCFVFLVLPFGFSGAPYILQTLPACDHADEGPS
eukprot:gene11128-9708_t